MDIVVDNLGAGTLPLRIRDVHMGRHILTVGSAYFVSTMGMRTDFAQLMSLAFEGRLTPPNAKTFALNETRLAHACIA